MLGERADVRLGLFVEPCDGELGAEGAQLGGAAIGDGMLVRDPDDQPTLAREHVADAVLRIPYGGQGVAHALEHGLSPLRLCPARPWRRQGGSRTCDGGLSRERGRSRAKAA